MTPEEFHTTTAIVFDRWPFNDELAQSAYIARLWEVVSNLDASQVRDALERLAAQEYRGRLRPTGLEIAESVRASTAPTGTFVRHPVPDDDERTRASEQLRAWRERKFKAEGRRK